MRIPDPPPRFVRQEAPDEAAFALQDGQRARDLEQLVDALARASPSVVWYHREHFVPWLRDVVGDAPLAARFAHYAAAGGDAEILRETLVGLGRARLAQLR